MMRSPLDVLIFVLILDHANASPTTSLAARMAAYQSSRSVCEHGQADGTGIIVLLKRDRCRLRSDCTHEFINRALETRHVGDRVTRAFTGGIIDGLAGTFTDATIATFLGDPDVESIEPDCTVLVDEPEMDIRPLKHVAVSDGSPVSSSVQVGATWGIDRIDARLGLDNTYSYGDEATNSRIYILDTGVLTSHDDFGGRALGGWSAGCQTGNEAACGSTWVEKGVITEEMGRTCNGHGTHCASTAGGSTYGVAKGTTIVTVQVLSCAGSGSRSGVTCAPQRTQPRLHTAAPAVLITLPCSGVHTQLRPRTVRESNGQ